MCIIRYPWVNYKRAVHVCTSQFLGFITIAKSIVLYCIPVYFGGKIFCKNAPKFLSRENIFANDPRGCVKRCGMVTLSRN